MADEVQIRLARERSDFDACVALQRSVWGLGDVEVTSAIQMIATTFAGGTVHLAEDASGQAVGFAYAFPAIEGGPHLHSDMLAVLPEHQKRGVGLRLKWAQREEALARGLKLITWTFDPLQAVNAHLNLRRLGAVATAFHENFYGLTSAELHHGFPTDRLMVRWQLDAPRVVERAAEAPPGGDLPVPDLPRVNDVRWQAGWPVSSDPRLDLDAAELLLEIPPEWDVVCRAAP
ncbi:MAG TPA: GNAT family N-acetyltransferase, partial [Vicinamibacteria bacterium]|nr:GNAT family N-acetyltransferase [Vicinamibacteria bacterium]